MLLLNRIIIVRIVFDKIYRSHLKFCLLVTYAGLKIAVGHRTMTDGEDLMTGNFFSLSDVLSDGESR